jgi:chromosome segregation ATPase
MIKLLSTPFITTQAAVSFQPFGKRDLRKEDLMQRIGEVQTRMNEWNKKTKMIKHDQASMHQTAALIQQSQEKIVRQQESLKKQQSKLDQDIIQIKQNHLDITQDGIFLTQIWKTLFQYALNIQDNQNKLQMQLNGIEQKLQSLHQHITLIHHNVPLIKDNFQHVRLKVGEMEHTACMIQASHQAIVVQVKAIEKKGDSIRQNISSIDSSQKKDEHKKRCEVKAKNSFQTHAFFDGMKKISDFCLWIIMRVCDQIGRADQYLWIRPASTDFSLIHPRISPLISWMAIGILAPTARHA